MSNPNFSIFSIIDNNELFTIFSDILPPEDIKKIKKIMKFAVFEMFLSPNTAKLRIEKAFLSSINKIPPDVLTKKLIAKFPEIMIMGNESSEKQRQKDNARLTASPKATILNQFLLHSFSQNPDVISIISEGGKSFDVLPVFAANPQLSIVMNNQYSKNNTTPEMMLRMTANSIKTVAELWYKPLLQKVLAITRLLTDKHVTEPNELGSIMSQCHNVWQSKYPELLCLLDDKIRIIRNSEAHHNTIIDASEETITFINQKKGNTTETLGPLTMIELAEIVEIGNFCIDMNTAFRVAEGQIREQL